MAKKICCICGKEIKGEGNEAWPIKDTGKCCDECNEKVAEARIALVMFANDDPD